MFETSEVFIVLSSVEFHKKVTLLLSKAEQFAGDLRSTVFGGIVSTMKFHSSE